MKFLLIAALLPSFLADAETKPIKDIDANSCELYGHSIYTKTRSAGDSSSMIVRIVANGAELASRGVVILDAGVYMHSSETYSFPASGSNGSKSERRFLIGGRPVKATRSGLQLFEAHYSIKYKSYVHGPVYGETSMYATPHELALWVLVENKNGDQFRIWLKNGMHNFKFNYFWSQFPKLQKTGEYHSYITLLDPSSSSPFFDRAKTCAKRR